MGSALALPAVSSPGSALFPHIALQNMVVRVNFLDPSLQQDGFKPWTVIFKCVPLLWTAPVSHGTLSPSFVPMGCNCNFQAA